MALETDDLVVDFPVLSTVIVAAIATAGYVGMQVVRDGTVSVGETLAFVSVFTFVYVSGVYYLRQYAHRGTSVGEPGETDERNASELEHDGPDGDGGSGSEVGIESGTGKAGEGGEG